MQKEQLLSFANHKSYVRGFTVAVLSAGVCHEQVSDLLFRPPLRQYRVGTGLVLSYY